jgi:hypothetical protein
LRWPRDSLHPQKSALISPTSGGGSVGIVRLRTKATEFVVLFDCESYVKCQNIVQQPHVFIAQLCLQPPLQFVTLLWAVIANLYCATSGKIAVQCSSFFCH